MEILAIFEQARRLGGREALRWWGGVGWGRPERDGIFTRTGEAVPDKSGV